MRLARLAKVTSEREFGVCEPDRHELAQPADLERALERRLRRCASLKAKRDVSTQRS